MLADRYLARIATELGDSVVAKGGIALELRLPQARATQDLDVHVSGSSDHLLDHLQVAGRIDLGDRLRFEISSPQYYQYQYKLGGPPITVQLPHGGSPKGNAGGQQWSAYARGDLDGNGKIAWFIREGYQRDGQMVTSSSIAIQDQEE